MEKKNLVKIIIVVVCLSIAAGVTVYVRGGATEQGLESMEGEMIEVKCAECGAEYEMELTEYYEFRREHADPATQSVLQPPCRECGANAIYEKEVLERSDF